MQEDVKLIISRSGIIRKKTLERKIDAQATFSHVWEQMALLQSQKNIENILERAIQNEFYGIDLDSILKQRKSLTGSLDGMPERFIEEKDIKNAAFKVVTSIKQAYEYHRAAKEVGLLTKPVLLYYGMVSLSKALIDSTYIVPEPVRGHGLKIEEPHLKAKIERKGAFQTFRDTYISDTSLYTNPENLIMVDLKELLSVIPGIAIEWELAYEGIPVGRYHQHTLAMERYKTTGSIDPQAMERYRRTGSIKPHRRELNTSLSNFDVYYGMDDLGKIQQTKNKIIHIIDAHFLAMFILCTFARYRPSEWIKIIEGSTEGQIFVINAFLRRSELNFPMLIYSEITGIENFFLAFCLYGLIILPFPNLQQQTFL